MGGHKAAALGDMHPGQQRRVACLIRRAVLVHPGDPLMDPLHFGDQPLRVRGGGKGGGGDKLTGAAQAAKDILAKTGVVPDAGQRQGMQHLQQQRANAAAQHRGKIAMHLPDG